MTIASSSVPAVTDALVDLLVAARGDVQVMDGPPPTPEDVLIAVGWSQSGPSVEGSQVRATLGQDGRRNEDYYLVVHCSAATSDDSAEGRRMCRDTAWGLLASLERVVTGDPSLAGNVNILAELSTYQAEEGYLEDNDADYPADRSGRYVAIEARIRIQNQLI